MSVIYDPPPKEATLEQHMIEFGKVTAASLNSAIDANKKYLILQGNKVAQIFIKSAFEFFEKHFPNKNPHIIIKMVNIEIDERLIAARTTIMDEIELLNSDDITSTYKFINWQQLTARCLQINVSAVRRFKKGPTEKTICQKLTRKSKADDSIPKSKETKKKKPVESNKNENKLIQEDKILNPPKPSSIQQNVNYQSHKCIIQEHDIYVPQGNRDFNSTQVPGIFPSTLQNNSGYQYSASGKNINYLEHDSIASQNIKPIGLMGTTSKSSAQDIFQLSPEPQYGAPSVALAANINQKNSLHDATQSSTATFQHIKPFGGQPTAYQYPNQSMPVNNVNIDLKDQNTGVLHNFGNIQSNPSDFKY